MQQLQRDPDPGQLPVHLDPVMLDEHALAHATAGKQQRIDFGLGSLAQIVPVGTEPVGGLDDVRDAVPGDSLRGRDCPAR